MNLILPEYIPNKSQRAFHTSGALNRLFLSGVGGGKTYAAAREIITMIFRCRDGAMHLVGAPSYRVLDASVWPAVCNLLDEIKRLNHFGLDRRRWTSPGNRQIEFINGSRLLFVTLSDPTKFAGATLAGFTLDEAALLPGDVSMQAWNMLVQRRRDPLSPIRYGIVCTTPRGDTGIVSHFRQQVAAGNRDFDITYGTTFDNTYLPKGYVEAMACGVSEREYRQQVLGEIVADVGQIFPEFDPVASLDPGWKFDTHRRKTYVAIDWGPNMPHALFIQTLQSGRSVVFDEIADDNVPHRHLIARIEERLEGWGISLDDLDAIHADPNPKEAVLDMRRRSRGVPVFAPRGKYIQNINRGIDVLKSLLLDWEGRRKLYFAPRLQQTKSERRILQSMLLYKWRQKTTPDGIIFDDIAQRGKYDHATDALRYWATWHYGRHDRDYKRIEDTQPQA